MESECQPEANTINKLTKCADSQFFEQFEVIRGKVHSQLEQKSSRCVWKQKGILEIIGNGHGTIQMRLLAFLIASFYAFLALNITS